MKKNLFLGIVISICVIALVVLGIVSYTSAGNNLNAAVNSGSCTGNEADCGSKVGCASSQGIAGCSGQASPYGISAQAGGQTSQDFSAIENAAVDYYTKTYNVAGISARASQAGCCTNILIIKDNRIIDSLSYKNGEFTK